MKRRRQTARAIVIDKDRLLVFERWRRDGLGREQHYFSIPGGGIEEGESPEEAVVREMQEEMSVIVKPLRLLARQQSKNHYHHYFLCEIVQGVPKFNLKSEEAMFRAFHNNRYEVAWLPYPQAASGMKHKEYQQLVNLLPELLAQSNPKTVDIVTERE